MYLQPIHTHHSLSHFFLATTDKLQKLAEVVYLVTVVVKEIKPQFRNDFSNNNHCTFGVRKHPLAVIASMTDHLGKKLCDHDYDYDEELT